MHYYRVDPLKRQYIGAMCGLGFSSGTGMSLYPEHDMELLFDTLITQHDIEAVINNNNNNNNLYLSLSFSLD